MTQWRVTSTGTRQWRGADGNWYPTEAQALGARPLRPLPPPPSVYRRPSETTLPAGGFLAILAAVAIVAGSFLPWLSLPGVLNRDAYQLGAGASFSIDGLVLLLMAVVVALIGFVRLTNSEMPRWIQSSTIVPGIVAIIVCLNRYFPIASLVNKYHREGAMLASVGVGIWIAAFGGLLAIVAGLILRSPRAR